MEHGSPVPGALLLDHGRCTFSVWASRATSVDVRLLAADDRIMRLQPVGRGYFTATVDDVREGELYLFRLDGDEAREFPDPASRLQPRGVHGPSAVVPRTFPWSDATWTGRRLRDYVIYELHVGTFTSEGTFDAVIRHLDDLRELGMTALEIMPVAEFPGTRNWGYDGAFPYAAHSGYGGPTALKRLVDASHRAGIAVVLDVVYNHLGPEGNYLDAYADYFSDRYRTPWGRAFNFDGPHSDEVRAYFIHNALQWTDEFRIDALRVDAVHAILDTSARPFLQELAERVHTRAREAGRSVHLIAESDLGDPRVIRPARTGGYDMDGQWLDDFHHALHTLLTGESDGYYADFGGAELLARSFREGFVYTGQYSHYRKRRHGAPAPDARPEQFVVFAQNHDQVGNRFSGDRLAATLGLEQLKLAAATVLLSPFTPLLFMGEEYGETAPFPYFVSHLDAGLVEAVRTGRRGEFAAFGWTSEPPDPQSMETFARARLDHTLQDVPAHRALLEFHRTLLRLRCTHRVLTEFERIDAHATGELVIVTRQRGREVAVLALNFSRAAAAAVPTGTGCRIALDSAAALWSGPGGISDAASTEDDALPPQVPPHSALLLLREA